MSLWKRLLGQTADVPPHAPLYAAVVAEARRPHWYANGGVPDTFEGRFDMVSTVLSLVLLRLDVDEPGAREAAARVTELFITDMDGQLRENGIGDLVVGKHVGRMMSQLGGRAAAYKAALAPGGDMAGAIERNLHRGIAVPAEARTHAASELRALAATLARSDLAQVLAGRFERVPA